MYTEDADDPQDVQDTRNATAAPESLVLSDSHIAFGGSVPGRNSRRARPDLAASLGTDTSSTAHCLREGPTHLVTPAQGAQALSHTVREAQRLREIAVLLQTMRNGLARPGPPDANPPGGVAEPAEQVMAAPPQHVRVCATRMGKTGTVRRVRLVRAVTAAV